MVSTTILAPVEKLLSICIILVFAVFGCVEEKAPNPTIDSFPLSIQELQFNPNDATALDSFFGNLFEARKFNGVAFFSKNGATHTLVNGFRNLKTKDTLQIDDQFQLASLSKPFTAFTILKLVDEGRLSLNDKVSDHLVCTPYTEVTIAQLLTHTSGIGDYAYVTDNLWGMPENPMVNADLLTMMECYEVAIYFDPGRGFDYCNTNYTLLASIVESVTNTSFKKHMELTVFPSLEMEDSEILDPFSKDATDYDVQGHYPSGDLKLPSYLDGVVGDKGVYSTVGDLYAFYNSIRTQNPISDSLWLEATTPQTKTGANAYYGYGWRIKPMPEQNDTLIYHNVWWRGFRTYFWMSSNQNKMCVILTNSIRGGYLPQKEIWLQF